MAFYFFAREFVEDAREFAEMPIRLFFAVREFPDLFRELFFPAPAFAEYVRRLVEYFLKFLFSARGLENFAIGLTNVARELTNVARELINVTIRLTICSREFGRDICQPYGSNNKLSEQVFKPSAGYSQLLTGNNNYRVIK